MRKHWQPPTWDTKIDGEEAEAEGGQWLGMWPILDPSALGAGKAVGDAPRWQAVVEATSRGAKGGEGTRHQPSATGVRFMLRSGGTLDGLFRLACCPLCGGAGTPLDLRHVLSGECTEGEGPSIAVLCSVASRVARETKSSYLLLSKE